MSDMAPAVPSVSRQAQALYLSTRDVADFLGFRDTASVVRLIESGRLPCARRRQCSRRVVYRPTWDEVRQYCEVYDRAMVRHVERLTDPSA